METLKYEIEFITPAFIGGADPTTAELRPASIVGMLRYWFRVIGGAFTKDSEELFNLESKLFGSSERAGKVWVRVRGNVKGEDIQLEGKIRYLFGISKRKGIREGNRFQLVVYSPEKYKDFVDFLIRLAITFGNLGYRARKGFGSMDFISDQKLSPEDLQVSKIEKYLRPLAKECNVTLNLSKNDIFPNITNIVIYEKELKGSSSGLRELENIGKVFWSIRRKNIGGNKLLTFEYIDAIGNFLRGKEVDSGKFHPRNHVFGLPIGFSSRNVYCKRGGKTIKAQAQLNWIHEGDKNKQEKQLSSNRRPAPFWITIKRNKVYATMFKSQFLPEDAIFAISAKGKYWKKCTKSKSPKPIYIKDCPVDWSIVEMFFRNLGLKKVFDREVLP